VKVRLLFGLLVFLFLTVPSRADLSSIRLLLAEWNQLQSQFDLNGDQKVNSVDFVLAILPNPSPTPGATTTTYIINANNRDAWSGDSHTGNPNHEVRINGYNNTNEKYEFVGSDSDAESAGMAFQLDIPPSATIQDAYITVQAVDFENPSPTGAMAIHLYDVTSTDPFQNGFFGDLVNHHETYPQTVAWPAGTDGWTQGVFVNTPSVISLVQTFVNRPDYTPGNYIGFAVTEGTIESGRYYGWEDFAAGTPATLTVTYLTSGTPLSSPTPSPSPSTVWPVLNFSPLATVSSPVSIVNAADGTNRLFIVEQSGRIHIIQNSNLLSTPFLTITSRVSCCGERGLLGLAFPPNFAAKQYFYVNYTNTNGNTVVSRFHVTSSPDSADPNSEEILLTVMQPFSNHNGGQLQFGPDGYLYIGMGDGGSGGDPQNRAQNPAELLGKILRIDSESNLTQYQIPPSNPFVGNTAYRPEIWALGLRNPWRFSFDRLTKDLLLADVGQNEWEELNWQSAESTGGENYGWRIMEGTHCYNPGSGCNQTGLTLPIAEYSHSLGCSITGGYRYRGLQFPNLYGVYLYADYCSGRIWGLRGNSPAWETTQLTDTPYQITTFGEDEQGELYVTDFTNGTIYHIMP